MIASPNNQKKITVNHMFIDEAVVPRVPMAKLLGVTVDSTLDMTQHIINICKICFYYLSWIRKVRKYLSFESAKSIVHALVMSRLDYCNSILIGLPKFQILRLQRVQNTAARVIGNRRKFDHISDLMKELHWLPVQQRVEYKVLTTAYKVLHNGSPEYLRELLEWYKPCRTLRTQDHHLLVIKKARSKYGERSFQYIAPRLWNNLPISIRLAQNFSHFKKSLKTHLFSIAYN